MEITLPLLLVFLLAALLKGLTGLGFSTLALPILALCVEPKLAIALVVFPSLFSNLAVMSEARHWSEAMRRFWPLYLASVPGLLAGFSLLVEVDGAISRRVLAIAMLAYAAWSLAGLNPICSARAEKWLTAPVGAVTGLINGLTGSQVMPVLPYLLALRLDKDLLVLAINLSFTLSSLIMLALLGGAGVLTPSVLGLAALGLPAVLLGVALGGRLRRRLPEAGFRRAVLVVLALIGVGLLTRG